MDSNKVSAFSMEKEILLQDGIEYIVIDITKRMEEFTRMDIKYNKEVTFIRLKNIVEDYSRTWWFFRMIKLLLN